MHTCRKWRHIAFASQGALRLRLFCTHGTPVQKNLDCWPALPIVVQYGGLLALAPPTPEDEDNIMAALKQSDRVISISLTVTTSLLKKLSTIEGAFSELQDLVLHSRDGVALTMPSAFRWGQRLCHLYLTRITFPVHLQPLYISSSTNLIDLQLLDAFPPWKFPLEMLMKVLSKLGRLRSFSLHFHSTNHRYFLSPATEIIFLPALTRLNYRGTMAYLKGIMTSIDAPFLEDIEITSFDNPTVAHSELNEFIGWMEIYKSHCGAYSFTSEPTISISLTQPGTPMRLKLQLLCKSSHMQISSLAQICLDSPFLFNDEGDLCISTARPPVQMNSSHSRELLELLNQITGTKSFYLDMDRSINVVHALQPPETQRRHGNILTALHKLYIPQPGPRDAALREAVVSFMISRRLSGNPIVVEYERGVNKHRDAGILQSMLPSSIQDC